MFHVEHIRNKIKACLDVVDDPVGVEVAYEPNEAQEYVDAHKLRMEEWHTVKNKVRKALTANDVFAVTSKEAAEVTVMEMYTAKSSADRQRAASTILDRALGKAVERSINLNATIGNMSEEELNNELRKFDEGGEGSQTTLVLDEGGGKGGEET